MACPFDPWDIITCWRRSGFWSTSFLIEFEFRAFNGTIVPLAPAAAAAKNCDDPDPGPDKLPKDPDIPFDEFVLLDWS